MDSLQCMAQKHEQHLSFYPLRPFTPLSCLVLQGKMKTKDSPHTQHSRSHSYYTPFSCVFYPGSAHSMLSKGSSGTSKLENKLHAL